MPTFEQYLRTNFSPKYTTSHTSPSTYSPAKNYGNYNSQELEDEYTKVWLGMGDVEEIEKEDNPRHIPWVDKHSSNRRSFKKSSSTEGIRDNEEYNSFSHKNNITTYTHSFYFREYHIGAKTSFFTFYSGEIEMDAILNLKEGDVLEISDKENYKIAEINDYGIELGILFMLKDMENASNKCILSAEELINFIKTGKRDV